MVGFIEIVLLSIALALDAFAVSISSATTGVLSDKRSIFRLAFHFGIFQALMPIAGWILGNEVEKYASTFDHWIAFGLLSIVGLKMIKESFIHTDDKIKSNPSKGWNLVLLSFATSIDALAVGFSLALINESIWIPSMIIGFITASLSFLGIILGQKIGERFGSKMEFLGGLVIFLIGIKILLTHVKI